MALVRIDRAQPLQGTRVRLWLTTGKIVERDLAQFLVGPVFESIRNDPARFREVRAEAGSLVWPNGAHLCPDVLIWGGPPPADESAQSAADALPERPTSSAS